VSGQLIAEERNFENKLLWLCMERQFDCLIFNGVLLNYSTVINLLREQRELAEFLLIVQNDSATALNFRNSIC